MSVTPEELRESVDTDVAFFVALSDMLLHRDSIVMKQVREKSGRLVECLGAAATEIERLMLALNLSIDTEECPYNCGHECPDNVEQCLADNDKIQRCWVDFWLKKADALYAETHHQGGGTDG